MPLTAAHRFVDVMVDGDAAFAFRLQHWPCLEFLEKNQYFNTHIFLLTSGKHGVCENVCAKFNSGTTNTQTNTNIPGICVSLGIRGTTIDFFQQYAFNVIMALVLPLFLSKGNFLYYQQKNVMLYFKRVQHVNPAGTI